MPRSLLVFIWQVSGRRQILLCLLTVVVSLLTTLPLELQRRIVDDAIHGHAVGLLLLLAAAYLGVLLVQGGLKYLLNVLRGWLVEDVARLLRHMIFDGTQNADGQAAVKKGAVVSMVASEVEDLAGFVGDSVSFPLLQIGTAVSAMGYLIWVEPRITSQPPTERTMSGARSRYRPWSSSSPASRRWPIPGTSSSPSTVRPRTPG